MKVVLSTLADPNTLTCKEVQRLHRVYEWKIWNYDRDMDLCERIIKIYQKERYEKLQRTDSNTGIKLKIGEQELDFKKIVIRNVKDCERIILSVCEERFPK